MRKFRVRVNGEEYEVEVEEIQDGSDVSPLQPGFGPVPKSESKAERPKPAPASAVGAVELASPMPGVILDIKVNEGDRVEMGKAVVVLEAMKMENEIPAPVTGTVTAIRVAKGQSVNTGDIMAVIAREA
ncbi:MAG: biotin/lipoyl-containing protein [Bacillota bacterium]